MSKPPRWSAKKALLSQGPGGKALWDAVTKPIVNENRKIKNAKKTVVDGPKENFLRLEISGQVRGGKNNYLVTRQGKHIPKKEWALWRDQKVQDVRWQLPPKFTPISTRCDVTMHYYAGDRRKRDMPAIIDALWHVLGKAGVIEDDNLLWVTSSTRNEDLEEPKVILHLNW